MEIDMIEKLNSAICFAAEAHSKQKRKSEKLPYIIHPMEVASIIGGMTTDVDTMIAGLLHDVVEDAGVSFETVEEKFGKRVSELVRAETEDKREGQSPEETWKIRKVESFEVLKNSDDKFVKILWLGDKLSNLRSIYRVYKKVGDDVFQAFHQKDKSEQKWYYTTVAELLKELSDTSAYEEYVGLLDKVFNN